MNKELPKILLIEDEPFFRELYISALGDAGFKIIPASDGELGLSLAQEENPNLIILDLMLPKKSGIEVLKDLKANDKTKNIPVVVVSNLSNEEVIKNALELGANGYLLKVQHTPIEVAERIKEFLEKN